MDFIRTGLKYNVAVLGAVIATLIYLSIGLQGMTGSATVASLQQLSQQQALLLGGSALILSILVTGGIGRMVWGWGRDGILGWINVIFGIGIAGSIASAVGSVFEPVLRDLLGSADMSGVGDHLLALDLPGLIAADAFIPFTVMLIAEIVVSTVIAGAVIQYIWRWD